MTGREYQKAVQRTKVRHSTLNMELMEGGIGLSGEAGEVAEIIKHLVFHGAKYDEHTVRRIAEELGDVLWYVASIAITLNTSLDRIMEMNIEKLKERYPDGFKPLGFNNEGE